jgi:hypothetical protein
VDTPEGRAAALNLIEHARNNYRLQSAGRGYELKVSFFADFGGQTQYNGVWDIDETFGPGLGLRWTAKAAAGYDTTRIDSGRLHYAEGTPGPIPLVLHEARGALLGAMPNPDNMDRQWLRTASASFNGVQLTCVLTTALIYAPVPAPGRSWVETEECIDPQSGLLRIHSLVPGRYALYDYTDPVDFHGHVLPRKVTISEEGKPVIELHVDSLKDLSAPDPALFVPTEQMRANGPATGMTGARKISVWPDPGTVPNGSILQPVVVFGLLTPEGTLTDAHSLQPSNPQSELAVTIALARRFRNLTPPGGTPLQQEVFVIQQFALGQ